MRTTRQFWNFRASATDPSIGELLLYGNFGPNDGAGWLFDEINPKQFRSDLEALGNIAALRVYVQSDGGDVFAAQAIHSILKRYPKHVTAIVDGWAASAATFVVAAADEVLMPANAMMMVHSPWAIVAGNARELRVMADQLDKVQEAMIAAYRGKTGLPDDQLQQLLEEETWMTAEDAVRLHFADSIEPASQIAASARTTAMVTGEVFDLRHRLPVLDAPTHGAFTGRHIHSHAANGAQGGDVMHHHVHEHNGDYHHAHDHEGVAGVALVQITDEAIAYRNTGTAPEGTSWSAPALSDFTSKSWDELTAAEQRHIAAHFVWTDSGNPPARYSDLGGPHHTPSGTSGAVGPAVFAAVSNGRMQQASWAADAGVRAHLEKHYHEFDRQAPWEAKAALDPLDPVVQDYYTARLVKGR